MSIWETTGKSDEWYTPRYIFDALGCEFDMDVAAPVDRTYCPVPAKQFITAGSLDLQWEGFVWMNPPFGGRNGISKWLDKMAKHGNGIALTPDRTSAPWWQKAAEECDSLLFVNAKVKFIKPDGGIGVQPGTGTTLFGYGDLAKIALDNASRRNLGTVFKMRLCKI